MNAVGSCASDDFANKAWMKKATADTDADSEPNSCYPDKLTRRNAEDVVAALTRYSLDERRAIGSAFHARGLADHTYAQRAAQADLAFRQCRARRTGQLGPQTESLATMADWRHHPGWRRNAQGQLLEATEKAQV